MPTDLPCVGGRDGLDHILLPFAKVQDLWALLFIIFGINYQLGSSLFCERAEDRLERVFCQEKSSENLVGRPHLSFLEYLEGEE